MAKTEPSIEVKVGQTWERRDGTRFVIERIDDRYAHYWLAEGSKPQFRSIYMENLLRRYRLVSNREARTSSEDRDFFSARR